MPGPEPPPPRASWLELGLIPAVTAFVLLTIPNLINQNGGIDAFVYTGFIHSYHDLVVRFGRTYYSTRVAFIDPARTLVFLFGDSTGYVLLRFVALTAALGSLWSIARRYYGAGVAAFCLVLFALHPVLVRSLLWDYVDGFATTYLLVGTACLIGFSSNPGPVLCAAAGACLALATNCYPFALAVGVLVLPSWLVLQPQGTSMRHRNRHAPRAKRPIRGIGPLLFHRGAGPAVTRPARSTVSCRTTSHSPQPDPLKIIGRRSHCM